MKKILLISVLSLNAMAADKAGLVTDTGGVVVQLKNEREQKLLPLKVNDDLFFEDTVLTGDASNAGLLLSPAEKRIRFFVYENSKLRVDPILIKDGKKNFAAKIPAGMIRVLTRKLRGDTLTIKTPNVTVGIRGTYLAVLTDTTEKLIWTSVENHRLVGAAGSTVIPCFSTIETEEPEKDEPVSVTFTPDQSRPSTTKTIDVDAGERAVVLTDRPAGRTWVMEKTVCAEPVRSLIVGRGEKCDEVSSPRSEQLSPLAVEEFSMDFSVLALRRCGG